MLDNIYKMNCYINLKIKYKYYINSSINIIDQQLIKSIRVTYKISDQSDELQLTRSIRSWSITLNHMNSFIILKNGSKIW